MEDVHHFDVDVALAGVGTTIMLDGRPLCGVRSIKVESGVDQVSKITLEIIGTAKLTGDGAVYVLDRTQEMTDKVTDAETRATYAETRATDAEDRSQFPGDPDRVAIPSSGVTPNTPVKDLVIHNRRPDGESP
jgi:hypothetical protein